MSPRTGRALEPHGKNNYAIAIKWFLKRSTLLSFALADLAKIKRYKAENNGRYIEEDVFYRILSYASSDEHELAYLLTYETGVRPHELLSITAQDVEPRPDGLVLVKIPDDNPETPSKKNKTGGRTIVVRECAEQLVAHANKTKSAPSGSPPSPRRRLFPFKNGALSVAFSRMKQRQRAESTNPETNYKGRLYDLRHTAITNLYLKGLTDQEVRKLVGWTPSSKMPDVYVHVNVNHIVDSLCKSAPLKARTTN